MHHRHPPARTQPARERSRIAARWWIDPAGDFHIGMPGPDAAAVCRAMGWVPAGCPSGDAWGVIQWPIVDDETPMPIALLRALDERFPGRRWFAERSDPAERAGRGEVEQGSPVTRRAA